MYIDKMGVYRCDCGNPIFPYARVKAGFKTCKDCGTKNNRHGFMVFDHKTAPTLVIVDADDEEAMRRAKRAHRRAR